MEKQRSFIVTKIPIEDGKEYTEKDPTHYLQVRVGDKWEIIGKGWTKDNKGGKFLSCQFSRPYKNYKGYYIETEDAEPTIDPETGVDCNDVGF